jgi:hypothetical protein
MVLQEGHGVLESVQMEPAFEIPYGIAPWKTQRRKGWICATKISGMRGSSLQRPLMLIFRPVI